MCSSCENIFVTIADVTNDVLPINIGFATAASTHLANEILLSLTYGFLHVVVTHFWNRNSQIFSGFFGNCLKFSRYE